MGRRGEVIRRRLSVIALVLVALLVAACGQPPPPPPAAPNWVTTQIPRTLIPGGTINSFGAWTSEDWFATLQATVATGSAPSADLFFYPRSGPGNSSLGTPQVLTPTVDPGFAGPVGDDVVGLVGSSAMEFFGNSGGSWSSVGTFSYPAGYQFRAMSDDWLVLAETPIVPGSASQVVAYPLDTSGSGVVVGAGQTVSADPAWPTGLQDGFGVEVAVDGGLMAVRAQDPNAPAPPGVLVLRDVAGVWTPEFSLGGVPGGPVALGQSLDVDDGTTADRFAVEVADSGQPSRVDVYADTGSGFALEQSIVRDTSEPDLSSGLLFGSEVALEGSLLAVSGRQITVPSVDPMHAPVTVGTVQLFRHGTTWQREKEVRPFTDPAPEGIMSTNPMALHVAGNHVATTMFVMPDEPPGCQFPCFRLGSEAWSIDRTN